MRRDVPETEISRSLAEIQERPSVPRYVSDSSAGVDLPLAECAQLSLNDHYFNIILKNSIKSPKIHSNPHPDNYHFYYYRPFMLKKVLAVFVYTYFLKKGDEQLQARYKEGEREGI
jgi:hypothetical protein